MFVCVVFVIVVFTNIIQTFYAVYTYEKQALENYYGYAMNSLEQFKSSTDEIIGAAMSLAVALTLDNNINEEVRSGQARSNSNVMQYVKDSILITSDVVDVAFFNQDIEKVYSIKAGYINPDEYWQGMTLQTLMELEKKRGVVRPSQAAKGIKNLLTVCFPSNLFYDSYIIIDLDFDEMQRNFEKYAEKLECELYVTEDSQILYQTNENLLEEEELRNIKEGLEDNDYKTIEIGGVKYGAVFTKSEFANMGYVLLEKYDKIKENYIMQSQLKFILIYIAILFVGLVILYLSMNRSYRPMRKITEDYRRLRKDKEKEREKQQLLEFITMPTVSEKTAASVQVIAENQLGEMDKLQLIMVVIDEYANFLSSYTSAERSAYKYAIENICTEILSEYYKCIAVECGENSKIFLISSVDENEHIQELLDTCAVHIKNYLNLSISIIIARKCDFDDLNDAYNELIALKNYRLVFPKGTVITSISQESNSEEVEKCASRIKTSASEGDFADIPMLLNTYIQLLRKSEPNEIIGRLINLFAAVYEILMGQIWGLGEASLHKMMRELLNAETEEDVKREFMQLFKQAERAKTEFSNNKYQVVVEGIYKSIDENWADPSFCVDVMAQRLKYSSVYLSRIFKYVTGNSLSNSIMQRRLEESAKLLRNSAISVKEVFEKCGFSSNSYFSVLFKKQYGVTPSEYKRNFTEK